MKILPLLSSLTVAAVAGCAGQARYACPIPDGVGGCRSLAQVYRDTQALDGSDTPSAGTPSSKHSSAHADDDALTPLIVAAGDAKPLESPGPGTALLSQPRVLRVLITPWPDADGDFQAGGHLYLRLDAGQWTIPR